MTNAGVHIQLAIMPVTARTVAPSRKTAVPGESIFAMTHFAFLRCKLKRNAALVAVCVRGTLSNYSRVAFDHRTVYHIEPWILRHDRIQITSFTPVWIAKLLTKDAMPARQIPSTVKTLAFELWLRGQPGVTRLAHDGQMLDSPPHVLLDGFRRLQSLGGKVPQEFALSEVAIRHYLTGTIAARNFEFEVVTFATSKKRFGTGPSFAAIAFGVIDGYLWMDYPAITSNGDRRAVFHDYAFPSGSAWSSPGSMIRLAPDPNGYFFTHQSSGHLGLYVQVVQSQEEPEVRTLRIYLTTAPKKIQEWKRGTSFTETA
jgi:hypothetical protein